MFLIFLVGAVRAQELDIKFWVFKLMDGEELISCSVQGTASSPNLHYVEINIFGRGIDDEKAMYTNVVPRSLMQFEMCEIDEVQVDGAIKFFIVEEKLYEIPETTAYQPFAPLPEDVLVGAPVLKEQDGVTTFAVETSLPQPESVTFALAGDNPDGCTKLVFGKHMLFSFDRCSTLVDEGAILLTLYRGDYESVFDAGITTLGKGPQEFFVISQQVASLKTPIGNLVFMYDGTPFTISKAELPLIYPSVAGYWDNVECTDQTSTLGIIITSDLQYHFLPSGHAMPETCAFLQESRQQSK